MPPAARHPSTAPGATRACSLSGRVPMVRSGAVPASPPTRPAISNAIAGRQLVCREGRDARHPQRDHNRPVTIIAAAGQGRSRLRCRYAALLDALCSRTRGAVGFVPAPSAINDSRATRRVHPSPSPVRRQTSDKGGGDVSATLAWYLVSGLYFREGAEIIRAIDLDLISEPEFVAVGRPRVVFDVVDLQSSVETFPVAQDRDAAARNRPHARRVVQRRSIRHFVDWLTALRVRDTVDRVWIVYQVDAGIARLAPLGLDLP